MTETISLFDGIQDVSYVLMNERFIIFEHGQMNNLINTESGPVMIPLTDENVHCDHETGKKYILADIIKKPKSTEESDEKTINNKVTKNVSKKKETHKSKRYIQSKKYIF